MQAEPDWPSTQSPVSTQTKSCEQIQLKHSPYIQSDLFGLLETPLLCFNNQMSHSWFKGSELVLKGCYLWAVWLM